MFITHTDNLNRREDPPIFMASDGIATQQQENASAYTFKMYIETGKLPTLGQIASIYPSVNAKWMTTFTEQAKLIKGYVNQHKGYNYSRDDGIMPFLESMAKTYCGVEGGDRIFATKDTWNPMDIVMVKRSEENSIKKTIKELMTIDGLTQKGKLTLLNSIMYESLKSKDMIPVSLKKINLKYGIDLEEELNTGNPEQKDWTVLNPKCLLNIKDRVFENSEFSMHFQLDKPPAFKIKVQVRNRQLSNPNGTVQTECINESKPAAKLGTVPSDLIDTFLTSHQLSKPKSISKHPNIPKNFPGTWDPFMIDYWVGVYNNIKNKKIGSKSVDFGDLTITGTGADESGIENVIKNGAANESAIDRSNNGRFRNILVAMEYVQFMQELTTKGVLNDFLNILYYGAKKAYDPLNGSFVKIF